MGGEKKARQGGPTSFDVARQAGVSQSTVSLVLSGKAAGRVSLETQEAVQQVAQELGYQPRAAGRILRLGRTHVAALIIPDVSNPFFANVLQGAELAARAHDYMIVQVSTGRDVDWQQHVVHALATQAFDGFLLCAVDVPRSVNLALLRGNAVLMDGSSPDFPSLVLDIEHGTREALEHLVQWGHRRIAHLGAHIDVETFRVRQRVYEQVMREAGLPLRPEYQATAGIDISEACQAALPILRQPEPPTAFLCDDDLIAAGVYRAARLARLQIPRDLSVVGFADSLVAQLLEPRLTTVSIPAHEVGRRAMELLLTCLEIEVEPSIATIPLHLTVRDSTSIAPGLTTRRAR